MFVFSHTFPLLWEFSYFPCFRNCMGFYFTRNRVVRNISETKTFGIFVFFHNFPVLSKFTILMFWELYEFLLLSKCVRNTWPWNVLFSHTFPVLSSLSPCFGDNTTDVKTNENFLFLIPFSHKCLCETLH